VVDPTVTGLRVYKKPEEVTLMDSGKKMVEPELIYWYSLGSRRCEIDAKVEFFFCMLVFVRRTREMLLESASV
jgi:hypothetical protein